MAVKRSSSGSAKSRARRAASKAKSSSSSKTSSSSSKTSSSSSSSSARYSTTDGKKFSDKSAATAHQRSLNAAGQGRTTSSSSSKTSAPTINYKYDPKRETESQYHARIERERQAVRDFNAMGAAQEDQDFADETVVEEKTKYEKADDTALRNSAEFKALDKDDQQAVLAVFNAVAANDAKKANRLIEGFRAASKINDPFFKEQLRLATDAIERGYVEIDREAEYKELQIQNRIKDLRKDYESKKQYLSLEQASVLRGIERQYEVDLEDTRQNLAASGFTSSSRRVRKEQLLNEATGDLRESTNRKFNFEQSAEDQMLSRSERDTRDELKRLSEITKAGKLDFLRSAEKQVGSKNLRRFAGYEPLGNLVGEIPRDQFQDTLSAATSFVF